MPIAGTTLDVTDLDVPLRPAMSAGLPEGMSRMRIPSRFSCRIVCGGAIVMPKTGRTTLPNLRICSTRPVTVSMGMANPTPDEAPRPGDQQSHKTSALSMPINLTVEEAAGQGHTFAFQTGNLYCNAACTLQDNNNVSLASSKYSLKSLTHACPS